MMIVPLVIQCPKCGTDVTFKGELLKPCPQCDERVYVMNTYCFFCGKITTHLPAEQECDNPECIEKYKLMKEEKKHPFYV